MAAASPRIDETHPVARAGHNKRGVRFHASRLPDLPSALLLRFALDPYSPIRLAVTHQPNAPHIALDVLSQPKGQDLWIREAAVTNPNCPPRIAGRRLRDPQPDVRAAAAKALYHADRPCKSDPEQSRP